MPKPLTPEEKTAIINKMYRKGIQLIRIKKLKSITVEDITSAAGLAKGTFYVYYKSKEEFLFQLIKRFETELMQNIVMAAKGEGELKTKVTYIFKHIYLASDSIAFSLTPEDVEWLLHKLPDKADPERDKSQNNSALILGALGISSEKCKSTTIHYLADCLLHIASSELVYYDKAGKEEAMDIMVNTIADYICRLADAQDI